jgi:hypothetical protein
MREQPMGGARAGDRERRQILCTYGGCRRELCPVILGHSQGQEKALAFQLGGDSAKGLPVGGEWRCLWLAKSAMSASAPGHGMRGTATAVRKAAWRLSISTSTQPAPTPRNVALPPP